MTDLFRSLEPDYIKKTWRMTRQQRQQKTTDASSTIANCIVRVRTNRSIAGSFIFCRCYCFHTFFLNIGI